MRVVALGALAALVLGACGDTVADKIDAVQHLENGLLTCEEPPASLFSRLREDASGRALLEESRGAVPTLISLLDDASRRTFAAACLAGIDDGRGASELLRRWRDLRKDATALRIYQPAGSAWVAVGRRYEGVDEPYYAELLEALGRAGRTVSSEIAKDTQAAMAEAERLVAAGEPVRFRTERVKDGCRIGVRWSAAAVETAVEGLRMLATLDAPEAQALLEKATRSPVCAIRRTATELDEASAERAASIVSDYQFDAQNVVQSSHRQDALVAQCKELFRQVETPR